MRSVEAEKAYNKRWLVGLIVGPLLMGVLAAVWILTVEGRLPAELASHWNSKNEVDGWISVAGAAAMAVAMGALGAVIAPLGVLLRASSSLTARIGVGFGLAFGVGMVALTVAMVAGQLDLADTSQAELSGPVMAGGVALAFVAGVLGMLLYKPGEVDRTQGPEVLRMNQAATSGRDPVAQAGASRAARGDTMRIKVSMGKWSWLLSLGLGAIVAASTYFIFPILALLGLVAAVITWVFCNGTVVIGPEGHKVLAGGFWKVMPLEWREVRAASVEDIKAMDYGGWGYRMNGGSIGFIMGSGPALVMEAGFHQKFVVSMPDVATAGEAAALVNAYVHAGKVPN
ncbi:DUF1648 domain-containing protein [Arthrobacter sp. PAMC 25486]|uniref:DUF1648 domain-containing protein n=1 Tax=Arthrobacter sp. PAMC 25486 TaxID=1494608 RepID=UPI0012FF4B1F|nr:DUF1648 domain-containing protein [Arthrobacter sp. PAMC 25486]